MLPRVMTALVGVPLLVFIIGWAPQWLFSLLIFVVTVVALWEYFSIAYPRLWKEQVLGVFLGVLVSLGIFFPRLGEPGLWLGGSIVIALVSYLFIGDTLEERYRHLGWTVLGSLYAGYLLPHLVLLYRSPDGKGWLFFLLLVIMVGDAAAYFVGTSMGKRKLCPEISPGKTIEGALGSAVSSVLAGIIASGFLLPGMSALEALFLSLGLNILGQVGDLVESWIKRVFSVKDSGALLPGHGGLLDRVDSLIFPVVFTMHYVRLFYS